MNKHIVHVGLPKTGTSFLQKKFFPHLNGVNFFRSFSFRMLAEVSSSNIFLFSHESISGHPWNKKWIDGEQNPHHWLNSFDIATENLKKLYPNAHIIIVFRKHGDLLISLYKQYLHEGGVLRLQDFYSANGVIRDEDLNFQYRIEKLTQIFENVDVLSFEDFKYRGVDYFIDYFKEFSLASSFTHNNKNENSGVSGKKIEMIRMTNKFYRKIPRFIRFIFFKTKFTPRDIFQHRLGFWNSPDSRELLQIKEDVNSRHRNDWEFVIKKKKKI